MDAKIVQMLNMLQDHPGMPAADAAKELGVSTRTVRTYVSQANRQLTGIASITMLRGKGYIVEVADPEAYEEILQSPARQGELPQTSDERVRYLLNDLLFRVDWVTLDSLAEMLFVSRVTISDDLRAVERELASYGLVLIRRPRYGVRVEGPELSRRLCLAGKALSGSLNATDDVRAMMEQVAACVDNATHACTFVINSTAYQNLLVHITIAVIRMRNNCYVPLDDEQIDHLVDTESMEVARHIAACVGKSFGIELPQPEIAYLAIHLAGKQSLYLPGNSDSVGAANENIISDKVWAVVTEMLNLVWEKYQFDFRNDLELRMNLAQHIVPLSVRLSYHMNMENPLLNDIKTRFPLAYSMAVDAGESLTRAYGAQLSEAEAGYIAMSFALALERQKSGRHRKNILVVCASGAGSARLLEYQCREEFGTYINTVTACDVARVDQMDFSSIDYVFTTVSLPVAVPVPVRMVSSFLTDADVEGIRRLLREGEGTQRVLDLFTSDLFFPHLSCATKWDAIHTLCEAMVSAGVARPGFEDAIIEREQMFPTSFGGDLAVPHAAVPTGDTVRIAVGLCDAPIVWDEDGHSVSVVFLVSYSEAGKESMTKIFSTVASGLLSPGALDELVRERTFGTLIRLLTP